jgi:hypothetical protein
MKNILTILFFFLLTIVAYGQEVKHYDLKVKFNVPKRIIEVEGNVNIDLNNQDSITFTLWKGSYIDNITIDGKSVDYSFDTIGISPNFYIPNGGKLIIKNIKKTQEEVPIHFIYKCNMENVAGWAKSFSDEWIELGFYTAWYPVHNASKKFTSSIIVTIDKSFTVSGSGIVTRQGNEWKITHNWPVFDNVIIAAKGLKTIKIREEKIALDLVYTTFPEKDLDSTSIKCKEIYKFFSSIFGTPDDSYLKFVINPLKGVGGYGRSKYFSLKASEYNQYLINGIAHEMSHFWWHNAETTTWEDWLNEAFAEYSMLLYLREKYDKEEYNKNIEQYKKWTVNSRPIWEVDRDAPEAYDALYNKGSLILVEFEKKIGTQKFYNFLRILLNKKISNTADFLKLIEFELSKDYRDWFEYKLKT